MRKEERKEGKEWNKRGRERERREKGGGKEGKEQNERGRKEDRQS